MINTSVKDVTSRTSNAITFIAFFPNAAFTNRVIRKSLIEDIGIDRDAYAGFMSLSQRQFLDIANIGGVDEGIIVH